MSHDTVTADRAALRLHVATDGCDGWSGRYPVPVGPGTDGPLASIAAARDRIRAIRTARRLTGPVEVLVHAGRYELAETLLFTADDLADDATPVTYRAAGDGEVRLTASRRLDGFLPHDGPVVRLPLRDEALRALPLRQLCFDGSWLPLARYPSRVPTNPYGGGWAYVPGEPVDIYTDGHGVRDSFRIEDPRPAGWSRIDEVQLVIFPRYNWINDIVPVAGYDAGTGEVRLAAPTTWDIYPGDRYYFQNVREELDQPGEWYHDRDERTVYLYPPAPLAGAVVETPAVDSVIVVDGPLPARVTHSVEKETWDDRGEPVVRQRRPADFADGHLTFQGFVLEGCGGDAVVLRNVRACQVVGCTVRTAGGFGVRVISGAGCTVVDCDITAVGKAAVEVSGGYRSPFNGEYEPCGHEVRNNYLHHFAAIHKHNAGISVNGVGIRVGHNLIHDGPRWGIIARGNDNVYEYNHIRHVNIETADTAAIYLVDRDLSMRGTKIRYNRIHDILGYDREDGAWRSPAYAYGIYLDDWTSGVHVHGNLIYRTPRGGVYLHAGQDNLVENNLCLAAGREAMYFRRWSAAKEMLHLGTHDQGLRRNVVRRNVLDSAGDVYAFDNVFDADGGFDVAGNVWEHNFVVATGRPGTVRFTEHGRPHPVELTWEQWRAAGHDAKTVTGDPGIDPGSGDDFRLRPDSPVLALGFAPLPVDLMGVQASPTRASWPVVEATGAREQPLTTASEESRWQRSLR